VADIEAKEIMVPLFQLGLTLNDWFDPIFIQYRVELLKKSNKIDSEDGDRQEAPYENENISQFDILSHQRE
jgi:hypothetical protein